MNSGVAPAVTISLVTWNGLQWLPGCLDSVGTQTLEDYELLVFDNGSTDGSIEWLRERAAADDRIRLVESEENLGYAPAHNRNIEAARGEAVLLLNQDVELDTGFLEAAVAALAERSRVAAVQGLIWRLDGPGARTDVIDTAGLVMHRDRRVVSRDQRVVVSDPGTYRAIPVWGADGPAPVFRRSALVEAREPRSGGGWEVLDEDFFAYKEDVDLAWRLQRLGWSAWFEPAARAWHARGGGDTGVSGWREVASANLSNPPRVRALSWRNQRLMQLKNEELGGLLRDLPWVALRELQSWIFVLLADPRRLNALPELLRAMPAARRKRRYLSDAAERAREGRSQPKPLRTRLLSRLRVSVLGKVIVYARLHGWRATADRGTEKMLVRIGAARSRDIYGPPVPEVRPDRVRIELDRPRLDAREGAPRAMVLGWAHAPAGVDSVELYLDGEFVGPAFTGRSRPDVEVERQHLTVEGIAGFGAIVPLIEVEVGPHVLHVIARDRAGNLRVLARSLERIDPVAGYQRLYELGQAELEASLAELEPIRAPFHFVIAGADGELLERTLASLSAQRDTDSTFSVLARGEEPLPFEVDGNRLVGFLQAGDVLSPMALRGFAAVDAQAAVIYADHDAIGADGLHREPWHVSDWSPDRLLSQDYIRGAFVARDGARLRELLADPPDAADPGSRYSLLLALTDGVDAVEHVPHVLWSEPLGTDPRRESAEVATVQAELERRGSAGAIVHSEPGHSGPIRRLEWPHATTMPRVSVIVPTTGRSDVVDMILATLGERTAYPKLEVVFVDNGRGAYPEGIHRLADSGATVIERHEPFNWSRLNNAGAAAASGDLLLFLNDDIEATDPDWMDDLVRQVQRPEVGVVGSMLLYPDGMIQHAGVLLVGHGGGAAHWFQGLDPDDDLYLDLQRVTREVSAVTGACLMVKRPTFEEVGGFDEELEVSGNDVDFCVRVAATGRRVLWTPFSRLTHHESRSRGSVPYVPDQARLWERWEAMLRSGDPYFNPNLDADRVDCDLDWGRLDS